MQNVIVISILGVCEVSWKLPASWSSSMPGFPFYSSTLKIRKKKKSHLRNCLNKYFIKSDCRIRTESKDLLPKKVIKFNFMLLFFSSSHSDYANIVQANADSVSLENNGAK